MNNYKTVTHTKYEKVRLLFNVASFMLGAATIVLCYEKKLFLAFVCACIYYYIIFWLWALLWKDVLPLKKSYVLLLCIVCFTFAPFPEYLARAIYLHAIHKQERFSQQVNLDSVIKVANLENKPSYCKTKMGVYRIDYQATPQGLLAPYLVMPDSNKDAQYFLCLSQRINFLKL